MAEVDCGFSDVPGGASGSELLVTRGPTLAVDIGFDPNFKPAVGSYPPAAGIKGVAALVDTGATISCIDNLLASQLNLPIVDRRPMSGAHGSQVVNIYLAQVFSPALSCTVYGEFAGVDLRAGGQVHSALIGRTFLQAFHMIYEGTTGTVKIISP